MGWVVVTNPGSRVCAKSKRAMLQFETSPALLWIQPRSGAAESIRVIRRLDDVAALVCVCIPDKA
jgi:hypothetical protein